MPCDMGAHYGAHLTHYMPQQQIDEARHLGYPSEENLQFAELTKNSMEPHHVDVHRGIQEWLAKDAKVKYGDDSIEKRSYDANCAIMHGPRYYGFSTMEELQNFATKKFGLQDQSGAPPMSAYQGQSKLIKEKTADPAQFREQFGAFASQSRTTSYVPEKLPPPPKFGESFNGKASDGHIYCRGVDMTFMNQFCNDY